MGCASSATPAHPGFHHDPRARWEQRLRDVRNVGSTEDRRNSSDEHMSGSTVSPPSAEADEENECLTQILVEAPEPKQPNSMTSGTRHQRAREGVAPAAAAASRLVARSNPLASSTTTVDDDYPGSTRSMFLTPSSSNVLDPDHSRDCGSTTCIFDEGAENIVKASFVPDTAVVIQVPHGPITRTESVGAFSSSCEHDLFSAPSFANQSLSFYTNRERTSPKDSASDRRDSLLVTEYYRGARNFSLVGSAGRGSITPTYSAAGEASTPGHPITSPLSASIGSASSP